MTLTLRIISDFNFSHLLNFYYKIFNGFSIFVLQHEGFIRCLVYRYIIFRVTAFQCYHNLSEILQWPSSLYCFFHFDACLEPRRRRCHRVVTRSEAGVEAMSSSRVVELNVGGVQYATSASTLMHDADSLLAHWFSSASPALATDSNGRSAREQTNTH